MNFTKLIGVLIFAVSFNAYSQNTNTTDNSIDGWKTLKEKNYSINYPDSWMLNTSGQMGVNFILFSPLTSEQDKFKDNINFLIQDLRAYNFDLDKFVEISESQIKKVITNAEILESKRLTSNSIEFHKIIYTGQQGMFKLIFEQYYWFIKGEAFVLTLTCEEKEFETHKVIGEKILNSFQINNN